MAFGLSKNKKTIVTKEAIKNVLSRGVEDIFVKENLEKKLNSGKVLRIKLGFDPTGTKIHIGRAIVLRKLKAFQDLGHKVVFIIGDFTARIGDPSDKLSKRPMLSVAQIKKNLENYKKQVGLILDLSKAEFYFNSKWLAKLNFEEIANLAESFSVQQMSTRRNFQDRLKKGEDVSLREFLYPLMQGYDSFMVKADLELGGFDQLFNLKAGRIIQKYYKQEPQDILVTKMLPGTDGRKMSTSWGNTINITDEPFDMYGKIMSLKDDLIEEYFLLCTDISLEKIKDVKNKLASGENPKVIKMELAREIVSVYHGDKKAKEAEDNFVQTFSKGGVPENVPEIRVLKDRLLVDVLIENKLVSSKSEWRRLVEEGAVSTLPSAQKITDSNIKVFSADFKIGKKRFVRVVVE